MGNKKISFEIQRPTDYRPENVFDDNLDIRVHLENGDVYWGTFFTLANIGRLMDESGNSFFWATNMVILSDLSDASIERAVEDLVQNGYLADAFAKIDHS